MHSCPAPQLQSYIKSKHHGFVLKDSDGEGQVLQLVSTMGINHWESCVGQNQPRLELSMQVCAHMPSLALSQDIMRPCSMKVWVAGKLVVLRAQRDEMKITAWFHRYIAICSSTSLSLFWRSAGKGPPLSYIIWNLVPWFDSISKEKCALGVSASQQFA